MKKILTLLLVVVTVVMLSACGAKEEKKVELSYVSWAEGIAMTNLVAVILEDKMDYEVDMTLVGVAPAFISVANGNSDAFLDVWMPTTHESYMEEHGDDVVDLGASYEGAKIGLVVPSYMDIDTIEELADLETELDGKITGIEIGSGIMSATDTALTEYSELANFEAVSSSEAAMIAELDKAIKNEEPIVITGWAPHWIFGSYDLKFLEDSKEVYGGAESIRKIVREGLEDDHPEVFELLENFSLTDAQLSELMGEFVDTDKSEKEVARAWMNANEDLVNSWLPAE
jgi:glycine betaine/proline transport system substrate-binding protein